MRSRVFLLAAMAAAVAACSSTPTAPAIPSTPAVIQAGARFDETPPTPPPADTTANKGGLGSGAGT